MFDIIPIPLNMRQKEGFYALKNTDTLNAAPEAGFAAALLYEGLQNRLKKDPANPLPPQKKERIRLEVQTDLTAEEYIIDCDNDLLLVRAADPAGFLYAVSTLRQIFALDIPSSLQELVVDNFYIHDKPRYPYRGFMLDESRHFFGTEEVKRLLDLMALHKLNVFHWHLSDDQGYRIESKKFPKLTEISTVRADTQIGGHVSGRYRGTEHRGFYTHDQIREIVQYAKSRNIDILPEIDLPGHFSAILAAYPELSCTGENISVKNRFGIFDLIACGGNADVYVFLKELLSEASELFPFPYFHIGGDEAPKKHWKACPLCQEKIARETLADENDLQVFMMNELSAHLKTLGKRTVCWNDCLSEKLDSDIFVQYWTPKSDPRVAEALASGRKILVSRCSHVYLDYPHALTPLQKTYAFEPELKEFAKVGDVAKQNILGVEAPLWTEWVYDREKIDFNIFPRLSAVAETAWSAPENKNYRSFLHRLTQIERIYDALGINYAATDLAQSKSPFRRVRELRRWVFSDQYSEVKQNRKRSHA